MSPPGSRQGLQNPAQGHRHPSRTGWAWATLVVGVVLGVALLDFLVQNTRSVRIEFFTVSGHVPAAVALFAAALAGAAVTVAVALARMAQIRYGRRRDKGVRGVPDEAAATPGEPSEGAAVSAAEGP